MQKIAIIGVGYVGLVTGACFAEVGFDVVCVDSDAEKIAMLRQGRSPIYENGLEDLILGNRERLRFTTDMAEGLRDRQAVFLAVGTPTGPDGGADMSYAFAAAAEIGRHLDADEPIIAVKSTVPIGSSARIASVIRENLRRDVNFHMVSCPEFLREGTAVKDVFEADRVIIGADSVEIFERMAKIYRRFDSKMLHTDINSAEMIKYASNAFLATKISFANEIANLCELVGADIDNVMKGVGLDSRIGEKFLRAGIGFGGSCFPKDTNALLRTAEEHNYDFALLRNVVAVNYRQAERFLAKIRDYFRGDLSGRTAAVWGLSYKPGTNDVRESPALRVVSALDALGCRLKLYDPAAMPSFRAAMPEVDCQYAVSAAEAAEGADMVVLLTEWEEFRSFPLDRLGDLLRARVIFDGRNCFSCRSAHAHGFDYYSVGRADTPVPLPRAMRRHDT